MQFKSTFLSVSLVLTAPLYAEGFKSIFNGNDLTGWDGDPQHWSVVDGVIRGDSTKNRAKGNTFIVWRDGTTRNFELKLKYRIHGGNNSGVQYRSKEVSKWVVSGYQSEVQNLLGKTGFLYHERGRGWLVDVGDFMEIENSGRKLIVGEVSDLDTIKKAPYHTDKEWNAYHFICRGNHVIHYLNGYQTVELIDNDLKNRCMEGVLALQVHGGSPMTVDFKDIEFKELKQTFGEARRLFNGADLDGWTATDEARDAWTVEPFTGPGKNRQRKARNVAVALGGVLHAKGGDAPIAPVNPSTQYILRFQKKDSSPSGEFHSVLGWSTHEVHVTADSVSYRINGKETQARPPVNDGKIKFSAEPAEYRNIVLIPIEP